MIRLRHLRLRSFTAGRTFGADIPFGPSLNIIQAPNTSGKSTCLQAVIYALGLERSLGPHPLPFDLQHNKGPIFFDCPDDADLDRRQAERAKLAKALAPRLRAILTDKILLAARIPPAPLEPHPNDLTLIARWRQLMTEPLRLFLREHNFGDVYARGRVAPLHDVAETWLGAQYELDDGELQRPFAAFLEANRALCGLLVAKTHLLDTNTNLASPKTTLDRRLGTQKSTLEAIDQLNKAASHLADTVDDFDRAVRGRIRVAIAAPEAAGDPARDWANHAIVELSHDRNRGGVPRLVSRPCLTIRIAPYAAHSGQRLDPRAVEQAQLQFPPDEKVRIEESSDARQWWTCAVPMQLPERNPETCWLARLVRPGVIEAEVTIGYRVDDDNAILIDGAMVEREFVGWSERLAGALAATGLTGGGLIQLSLDGTEDVVLRRARPGGKKIGAPSLFLALIDVPDLSAPLAPSMHEAFDILWQSAGWRDGSPSFPDGNWSGPQPSRAAL